MGTIKGNYLLTLGVNSFFLEQASFQRGVRRVFFVFRVDPFFRRDSGEGSQQEIKTVVSIVQTDRKSTKCMKSPKIEIYKDFHALPVTEKSKFISCFRKT